MIWIKFIYKNWLITFDLSTSMDPLPIEPFTTLSYQWMNLTGNSLNHPRSTPIVLLSAPSQQNPHPINPLQNALNHQNQQKFLHLLSFTPLSTQTQKKCQIRKILQSILQSVSKLYQVYPLHRTSSRWTQTTQMHCCHLFERFQYQNGW